MSSELRQQIERVVPLTDEEFAFVLSHFQAKRFKKHQIIVHDDDYVRYDYYVVNGLLKAAQVTPDGKEYILQFGLEDQWITDARAYNDRTKATLTLSCLEDTVAFALPYEQRESLCKALQKMEYFFRQKATTGFVDLQNRVLCLLSSTASKRYHNLLLQYPGLMQRIPKTMVASYLGVTRETLSRLVGA